jgi:putative heme-binding domain-containing protein
VALDQDLFAVIRQGISGTGMPGTRLITEDDTWQLVRYTRSLGQTEVALLQGDPARGEEIYNGEGLCFTCHIVAGKGSSLGRDLTDVGARRGPEYLRDALINPGASRETMPRDLRGYAELLMVRVVTRDGEEFEGMRVNEDGFTIQIRDASNRFHSFRKLDLVKLDKQFGKSLMQSYETVLSPAEIDDVVAYLASLRGTP